jgi:hypothetical protein
MQRWFVIFGLISPNQRSVMKNIVHIRAPPDSADIKPSPLKGRSRVAVEDIMVAGRVILRWIIYPGLMFEPGVCFVLNKNQRCCYKY